MPSWKTNSLSNCLTAGWRLLSRWYSTGVYMSLCVCVRVCVYLKSFLGALDLSLKTISDVFLHFLSESSITPELLTRTKVASVFRVVNAVSMEINSIASSKKRRLQSRDEKL